MEARRGGSTFALSGPGVRDRGRMGFWRGDTERLRERFIRIIVGPVSVELLTILMYLRSKRCVQIEVMSTSVEFKRLEFGYGCTCLRMRAKPESEDIMTALR